MALDIYEDSLYGQLIPADWNKETVSSLILLVDGEEEFTIENNEEGEELLDYIDRWITAEGIITETDEELRIKVRNYTLEDEMDYEGDDAWQ
ncbi:hypothetical protein [Pseudodesulfovibrio sp. zrk46]|uniref:hypothetical protein n=1 Tax=Pseudodesulfovibrio sp. zrk46 TaxID=2725288 RepID=UPI00144A06FF|nr:hypothetical protein [Pseudodesulfovibrio sp. zrk46]QJB56818.1 hypothetical protein HFN16_10555 [Pseudodesulfovibrio sp. zrk46]